MIISEPKNLLNSWFFTHTGIRHQPEHCSYIGEFNADHKISAVLVFHNWEGGDIEIDVPPTRLSTALLRAARRFVVDQLGCKRVTFKFRADNDLSRRAAVRLGAQLEGRQRKFYPDGCDRVLYGLLKEEYKLNG